PRLGGLAIFIGVAVGFVVGGLYEQRIQSPIRLTFSNDSTFCIQLSYILSASIYRKTKKRLNSNLFVIPYVMSL
ncbi:hypothetical protein ACT4UT_22830, partial [Bacillus sp. B-TM1]